MADWPPDVDELRNDMKSDDPELNVDQLDVQRLQSVLDAAVTFVQRVRPKFNYAGDLGSELADPSPDLRLGTLRLAGRWHTRRRSPDALIEMGEMGSSRVPSIDPDIDRLLRIGRHALPRVG